LLGQEWLGLQANFEAIEQNAQWVKLGSMALALGGMAFHLSPLVVAGLSLLCWCQEAMLKAFQARLGERLLAIEDALRVPASEFAAMQLHSQWQQRRPGWRGLIAQYVASALRPTVVFPYLPLLLFSLIPGLSA